MLSIEGVPSPKIYTCMIVSAIIMTKKQQLKPDMRSYFKSSCIFYILCILFSAPPFTPPKASLLPQLIVDAFIITIVSYVINISQAKLLAKKNGYPIYPNQVLFSQIC